MSHQLEINGKQYHPSTELAKQYSYTADYISRLARDEKVLGTRIGRQWFIEPESLRTFVQQLEVEKRLLKEDLSRKRKLERLQKSAPENENQQLTVTETSPVSALALSFVILICGTLSGYLGFVAFSEGVQVVDLSTSGKNILLTLSDRFAAAGEETLALLEKEDNQPANLAANIFDAESFESEAGPQFEAGAYTTFPKIPKSTSTLEELASASEDQTLKNISGQIDLPFSDEVEIEVDNGELILQPIFENVPEGTYRLSDLLLVKDEEN